MKRRAIIAALGLALLLPVCADAQQPETSDQKNQERAEQRKPYSPRLGDIMITTQLHHFKLWYAGRVGNWPLAKYELAQIRASAADAIKYYPHVPAANMEKMTPAADDVGRAIEAKDSTKYAQAFARLTAACNTCHRSAGFEFIVIREPLLSPIETSPFSNEVFFPR